MTTLLTTPPTFTFQFSPTTNPLDTPVWVDISKYVLDFNSKQGRSFELNRMETGTASFTLDNTDRRFDPLNSSSPYYPNLLPLKKFQVVAKNTIPVNAASPLTVSGNEITDATRTTNTQGDGLTTPGGVAVHEGTTNALTNGGFETNTTNWTQVSSTLTRVTSAFKFGTASGNIVTSNLVANEGAYQTFTATAAPYTVSAWVRGAAGGTVRMAVRDNTGANPQVGSAVTLTGTMQRVTLTTTNLTAATWRCYVETDVKQNITFQIDGVQAELKPIATPYVETNGGTASRSAARVQAPSSLLNTTQGWIAMRFRVGWPSSTPPNASGGHVWGWQDDGNNFMSIRVISANRMDFFQRTAGGIDSALITTSPWNAGDVFTVVAQWTSTQIKFSVNGSPLSANVVTSAHRPSLTASTFSFGTDGSGALFSDSSILWAECGTGVLTDADVTSLNALPNSITPWSLTNLDPGSLQDASMMLWPSAAGVTAVWPAVTSAYRVPSDAYVFTGYIEQWPPAWEGPSWAQVDCTAIDAFEALAQADISSSPGTLTTAQGSNKDIKYTSNAIGSGNNSITIAYVNTGSLSIAVSGLAITVNINAGTTTASSIITAVNADPTAGVLVTAALAPGSTGAGAPAVMSATALTGGTFAQELSGSRINKVLDSINWPSGDRSIDAGQATVVAQTFKVSDHQKAKTHINDVENSELGYVFISGGGNVVYHDRAHRTTASLSTTSQATFGDGGGTELEYNSLTPNFDKTYIYNYVAITPFSGNVAQTASDATSINQYMLRTYSLSTLLINSTDSLALAQYILSIYKQPSLRFAAMTLQPLSSVALWLQALARMIGDRVTIVRRPPDYETSAGPPLSGDVFIESVAWKMNAGQIDISVDYEMSPSALVSTGMILDDSTLGKLDSGNVLGI